MLDSSSSSLCCLEAGTDTSSEAESTPVERSEDCSAIMGPLLSAEICEIGRSLGMRLKAVVCAAEGSALEDTLLLLCESVVGAGGCRCGCGGWSSPLACELCSFHGHRSEACARECGAGGCGGRSGLRVSAPESNSSSASFCDSCSTMSRMALRSRICSSSGTARSCVPTTYSSTSCFSAISPNLNSIPLTIWRGTSVSVTETRAGSNEGFVFQLDVDVGVDADDDKPFGRERFERSGGRELLSGPSPAGGARFHWF